MQGERCIPIKKKLAGYMSQRFPEFVFEGSTSQFYAFRRENDDGIYDHIMLQRDFYKGTISQRSLPAIMPHGKVCPGLQLDARRI